MLVQTVVEANFIQQEKKVITTLLLLSNGQITEISKTEKGETL